MTTEGTCGDEPNYPEFRWITQELDGRRITYTYTTEFLVQVGKHSKGSYRTRYRVHGNLTEAVRLFNGINIGNGYKKRLIAPSFNRPLLARAWS